MIGPYDRKVNDLHLSDILYPSGTLGKNSCIACTHLSLLYAPAVMLHSMRIMFTLMIFIDSSDSCHVVDPTLDLMKILTAILWGLVKFDKLLECIFSLFIVLARIIIGYSSSSLRSVFSLAILGRNCKIARLRYSFMSHTILPERQLP